jgi:hypothetical protein
MRKLRYDPTFASTRTGFSKVDRLPFNFCLWENETESGFGTAAAYDNPVPPQLRKPTSKTRKGHRSKNFSGLEIG